MRHCTTTAAPRISGRTDRPWGGDSIGGAVPALQAFGPGVQESANRFDGPAVAFRCEPEARRPGDPARRSLGRLDPELARIVADRHRGTLHGVAVHAP